MSNNNNLTDHQQAAAIPILKTLTSGKRGAQCVLAGYAGVGKTYVTGHIASALVERGYSVHAVTHAHKALSVLRAELPSEVSTSTIFSALGWRINPRTQMATASGMHRLSGVDVLIVDEASMVDAAMYESIQCLAQNVGFSVLWVGDAAQLPPVSQTGELSPVFTQVEEQHRLTEVTRQAKGSPIIRASMYVRECLETGVRPDIELLRDAAGDNDAVYIVPGARGDIANLLVSAIEHGLDARAVAYTNAAVNHIGRATAERLHPPGSPRFAPGDPVMFGSRLEGVAMTDEQGIVKSVDGIVSAYGPAEIDCYHVTVSCDGADKEVMAPVEDWGYSRLIHNLRGQLRSIGASLRQAEDGGQFDEAIKLRSMRDDIGIAISEAQSEYADLRHIYAMTAHKAQGSTFDIAVIDWADMQSVASLAMLCRLLYVACTRPRHYLALVT